MRLFVGRQHRLRIDVDAEQVANRVAVFDAVEAMELGWSARIHVNCGGAIQLGLEPGRDAVVGRVVWTPRAWRRHRAASQLDDDPLPRIGRIGHPSGVHVVQRETAGIGALVVTAHAVRGDEFPGRRLRPTGRCLALDRRLRVRSLGGEGCRDGSSERHRSEGEHQREAIVARSHRSGLTPGGTDSAPDTDDPASGLRRA